jgi:hypothetical protein
MQRLSSIYTRHINDRHGFDGALFRGRFRSRIVLDERYLLNACRYIHRNALDLPGVDDVAGSRWSSHRAYLGHRRVPEWLDIATVLEHFGSSAAFNRFVSGDVTPAPSGSTAQRVQAAIDAIRLVIAELAVGADNEDLGSFLRSATLAVFDGSSTISSDDLARELSIPTRSALRMAQSRSRRATTSSPALSEVVRRTKSIVGEA